MIPSSVASRLQFYPRALLVRLPHPGTQASFPAAVLFADISGYTTIAETLCAEGPSGVERLGRLLDASFRSYVRAVDRSGGEIASFAGDAFIAYWAARDGDLAAAFARASECARLLHLGPQDIVGQAPSLHVGMSAGQLLAARLGDGDRWHVLLLGPLVREACAAATRAGGGETCVATECQSRVKARGEIPATADTASRNDNGGSSMTDVATGLPRLLDGLEHDDYKPWIAQRRTVCALFVRLDGLPDLTEAMMDRLQELVRSLHIATRPYSTSSGDLVLDDKGLVFTLCLGVPDNAHADDAMRAVRAGLAIETEMARLGVSCAIGVATGTGVCMPLGGPERQTYWSVGRFMHIAGRLMEAANRGMLCTEDVADRVRRFVGLSPERPLGLKGLQWALPVFRARDAAPLGQFETLVGRDRELMALAQTLDRLEAGRGALIWMEGEPGIGKTALVHAFTRLATERGIACLVGGASAVESGVAYGAWQPVFAAVLHRDSSTEGPAPATARLLAAVQHKQLASLVNVVVPRLLPETEYVSGLTGQARADATLTVLTEVLKEYAASRLVIVLEDCHWMDSASWHLVLHVVQEFPQALMLMTSRPGTGGDNLKVLRETSGFTEMPLAALEPDATAKLVARLLEGRMTRPGVLEEIVESSVGNPLFAREYALLLSTREHSSLDPPSRAAVGSAESAPVTVRTLIADRLDGLSPIQNLALKIASAIGDRFSPGVLQLALTRTVGAVELDTILEELSNLRLVDHRPDVTDFVFQHALIREVAHDQLTDAQRRTLHQTVAEAIETHYRDDLTPYLVVLADHWKTAEVPARALDYADRAATGALAAGAFAEAKRLLDSCVTLTDDGVDASIDDRVRWQRQLADASQGMGLLEPRRVAAHKALGLAGVPRPQHVAGLRTQAVARWCRSQLERRWLAGKPPAHAERILNVARAYRHSAEVCYFNDDMAGMICDSANAASFAALLDPSTVGGGNSAELGGILGIAGLRRLGERILVQSIAKAEAAGNQRVLAHTHMVNCLYHVGIGDWPAAETSAQRCQQVCDRLDDRVTWTDAQAVRFWMYHYRSHEGKARDAAEALLDRAHQTGNRQHRAWAFRFLGLCELRRPDANGPAAASGWLQRAVDHLDETSAINDRLPAFAILALAQLKTGNASRARTTARDALAQISHVVRPISQSTLEGYSSLVAVALDAWREERTRYWEGAIAHCLKVLNHFSHSFPVGMPRYLLHRGDYYWHSGNASAARRHYADGEAAAHRLDMPYERTLCREQLDQTAKRI
jgi:class 3 adenylate cyclase